MTTTVAKPTRNVFALKAVRDLIKKSPAKHDQTNWFSVSSDVVKFEDGSVAKVSCGTTACVAGWASSLAGDVLVIQPHDWDEDEQMFRPSNVQTLEGNTVYIENRGREVLGLTHNEAEYLFDQNRTRAEVLDNLKALIQGQQIA